MIKSKVIEALRTLNKNELKELSDFVISPFYNKNKKVITMFGELKKFAPDYTSRNMTKQYVYSKVYPGNAYADKTFRNLLSDILRLIEKYFIVKNLEGNKLYEKYLLINRLSKKELTKPAEQNIREADRLFEDAMFDGGNIFFIKHLIEMEKDFLEIAQNNFIGLNMKEGEYLINTFLAKYMLFKMKFNNYRHKLGTEKISGLIQEFDKRVNFDGWMSFIEAEGGDINELILIYYYTTKFMSDISDEESFDKAMKLFNKHKSKIDVTETTNLYLTFTGFSTVKMAQGEKRYREIQFDLYNKMFEENLLVSEKEPNLHLTIFNNVVSTAMLLDKYEWSRNFIEEYTPKLLPEHRDTMYNFAYSRYYFGIHEYEKSLEHLSRLTPEHHWIRSRARILQLRLYYELGHAEAFFSLYDSLNHLIKNDSQLPAGEKENDTAFISLLNRLARIKFSVEEEKTGAAGMQAIALKLEEIKNLAVQKLKGHLLEWILLKTTEIIVQK